MSVRTEAEHAPMMNCLELSINEMNERLAFSLNAPNCAETCGQHPARSHSIGLTQRSQRFIWRHAGSAVLLLSYAWHNRSG